MHRATTLALTALFASAAPVVFSALTTGSAEAVAAVAATELDPARSRLAAKTSTATGARSADAAPATSASAAVTAPTVIKPRQGYGDWIGGRHAGPFNYTIEDTPNADMSKMVRTLNINAHTERQIRYKAILGTGAERRVMTGWVGGHGTKAQNYLPHMDFFFGLRPDETYRTIRIFRIP